MASSNVDQNRNATSSWSGYIHQGKVGFLVALRQLRCCIENEIENFEDYAIRYENAEDFDIVGNEEQVLSRHQVKAYINGNEREDYSDLFNIQTRKLENGKEKINVKGYQIHEFDGQGNVVRMVVSPESRFLHVIVSVPDFYLTREEYKSKSVNFENLLEKYSILAGESIREYEISFDLLPISLNKFEENKEKLLVFLRDLRSQIVFDYSKSLDSQHLFDKYFASKEKTFEECTIERISQKREYIINQFELQSLTMFNQIENRLQIIERTITYLQQRVRKLNNNIKSYQEQMIQKLKLPFYMYTAKILQNYQQGMGVLLTTQNNSNIRFIANSNSEQDVMYQLSSGQVAVISFAFTLALNTTFKISKEFRFLSIDDPIQDMDSMNVYALIDLIRHSLSDYQIIMSTHNDGSAMFIKYKFELFSNFEISNVGLKNIKDILLEGDEV